MNICVRECSVIVELYTMPSWTERERKSLRTRRPPLTAKITTHPNTLNPRHCVLFVPTSELPGKIHKQWCLFVVHKHLGLVSRHGFQVPSVHWMTLSLSFTLCPSNTLPLSFALPGPNLCFQNPSNSHYLCPKFETHSRRQTTCCSHHLAH